MVSISGTLYRMREIAVGLDTWPKGRRATRADIANLAQELHILSNNLELWLKKPDKRAPESLTQVVGGKEE